MNPFKWLKERVKKAQEEERKDCENKINIEDDLKKIKEHELENKDKKEKESMAKHFNDRYTFNNRFKYDENASGVYAGYTWMCPTCNKIHYNTGYCVLSGLQYPRYCEYPKGNRINMGIKLFK